MSENTRVSFSPTAHSISITPIQTPQSQNLPNVSFAIVVQQISEIDQDGADVEVVDISNLIFSIFYSPPTNSSNNEMWELSASLDNNADLSVTISYSSFYFYLVKRYTLFFILENFNYLLT
jgi:hypothetical protein